MPLHSTTPRTLALDLIGIGYASSVGNIFPLKVRLGLEIDLAAAVKHRF